MMELADVTDSKSVGSDTVRVQVPLPAPKPLKPIMTSTVLDTKSIILTMYRGVAQLVARLLWEQDVGGSNPFTPTTEE